MTNPVTRMTVGRVPDTQKLPPQVVKRVPGQNSQLRAVKRVPDQKSHPASPTQNPQNHHTRDNQKGRNTDIITVTT